MNLSRSLDEMELYAALSVFGLLISYGWWKLTGRTFDSAFYKLIIGFWLVLFVVGCVLALSKADLGG